MIVKKVKQLLSEYRKNSDKQMLLLKELNWANIYHDSIRGKDWLEKLPLNVGRWAGNYSFFYVLGRVLDNYKPTKILELGLGESTKFISTYLNHMLTNSWHTIVEQDEDWCVKFKSNFPLSKQSNIIVSPLSEKVIDSSTVKVYENFESKVNETFDLYVVDGPHGSPTLSRVEILYLADLFTSNSEFIIIFDDYNRLGEQNTVEKLFEILIKKNIKFYKGIYLGTKRVIVIGTEKYKHVASL
ncbi:hypothetical protein [Winogradskyella sp. UBA3174]|uniref:hypothetical protein n=1 Tax=Winogradskyella sp. UBA3174 TaxID=1947785 RepID=UPI0025CEC8C5|nr:hypothetical protein [Winogradskyella sp. UBA3174]|tara:strand:+ start:62200 stop:62925 length:726 start_codon:yes stop_codon:yes gene_type:complete